MPLLGYLVKTCQNICFLVLRTLPVLFNHWQVLIQRHDLTFFPIFNMLWCSPGHYLDILFAFVLQTPLMCCDQKIQNMMLVIRNSSECSTVKMADPDSSSQFFLVQTTGHQCFLTSPQPTVISTLSVVSQALCRAHLALDVLLQTRATIAPFAWPAVPPRARRAPRGHHCRPRRRCSSAARSLRPRAPGRRSTQHGWSWKPDRANAGEVAKAVNPPACRRV